MALATGQITGTTSASARSLQLSRWGSMLPHLLMIAGAATVVVGSYTTWATFYAGLIARNGVAGHGKYFIALAAAAVLASLITNVRGVWSGLRWAAVPVGVSIAVVAYRDLRNLDALILDPAAAFYLPGRGDGLFIIIVGAIILAAAPFATRAPSAPATDWLRTGIVVAIVAGAGMLVAGLYGEYYLHFATGGHAAGHTEATNSAHLWTAGGAFVLLAATHLGLVSFVRERQ